MGEEPEAEAQKDNVIPAGKIHYKNLSIRHFPD